MLVALLLATVVSALLMSLWVAAVRDTHIQRLSASRWETAAHALETEIALRKRAEESAQIDAKRASFGDQLIGIVSHDLRNPLNTIALCASAMARRGLSRLATPNCSSAYRTPPNERRD